MPSIVCRAIDGDGPHNRATSRQTTEVMASFKLKMGISNYAILNALRKRKEMMATVQQGQEVAAAEHDDAEQVAHGEQKVELQPLPPAAQMQQVEGTVSSTPSRSNGSPQAYDEYNVLYGDDQQQGGQRRPQGHPMGKADKVPIWKGASVKCWQEFTVSLQAWHLANWEFMTAAQAVHKVTVAVTGGNVSIRDIFMAQAITDNISDGAKIALVNTMACLDREREQVRFTEFKAAFRQTLSSPPPWTHFMGKIPVRITILRNTLGNAGAATDPGNAQRVSPGTSDRGTGPCITLRIGVTTPTSPPASVGPKTAGQVPRQ